MRPMTILLYHIELEKRRWLFSYYLDVGRGYRELIVIMLSLSHNGVNNLRFC